MRKIGKKRGVVLVIDDEPDICELFAQILGAEGWTVLSAYNGLDGVARNTASNPDVIILDLKMPKMDGIETLKAIRKTDPAVRVIILTGYGNAETIRDVLDLNVYEYIAKPFENETVRRVVKEALADSGEGTSDDRRQTTDDGRPKAEDSRERIGNCGVRNAEWRGET